MHLNTKEEELKIKIEGEALEKIKQLKESHNPSKSTMQVILEAIAVYSLLYQEYKKGFKICLLKDGKVSGEINLLFNK